MGVVKRIVKVVIATIAEAIDAIIAVNLQVLEGIVNWLSKNVLGLVAVGERIGIESKEPPEWLAKDEVGTAMYHLFKFADPENINDLSDYHGKLPDVVHLLYKGIVNRVVEQADGTPEGAVKAAHAYLRTNLTLNILAWWAGVAGEATSLGQIESFGKLVNAINWGFGFGWLSWIILGTPFQLGIAKPLEEYYTAKFRPKDLSKSDILELYTRFRWPDKLIDHELAHLGYRDRAVYLLKALSWKELSESHIKDLFQAGFIDKDTAMDKLKRLGYRDKDAELIFNSWTSTDAQEPRNLTKSEILKLYKLQQIDKNTAITYLTQLGYTNDIADMLLATVELQQTTEARELTQSKLEQAYINNVIDRQEYYNKLLELGYTESAAKILIELADKKKEPKQLHLRRSTITRAYSLGIISRDKALELIKQLGYTDYQANLIIAIADASKPKIKEKDVSVANLRWAYKVGIISKEEFINELKKLHYSKKAIELELAKAEFTPTHTESKLTTSQILKAWVKGLISDSECANRLLEKGYTVDDVALLMALEKVK